MSLSSWQDWFDDLDSLKDRELCCYHEMNTTCNYEKNGECCPNIHGDECLICKKNSLHPFNEQKRIEHTKQCLIEHEQKQETCAICLERIGCFDQNDTFRDVGKLQCSHSYCYPCIKSWQMHIGYQNQRGVECPKCRRVSNQIIRSFETF